MYKKQEVSENPFYQEWDTPFGVPPFDKIKTEHYLPAFKEAITNAKEDIAKIVDSKEEEASYPENRLSLY